MTTSANFTSIPKLNYDLLASPDTRSALINVGFLYLEHPPIPTALFDEVVAYLPRFFALPQERKDALRMVNSPQFLGYSRLGVERTTGRGTADQHEQSDLAMPPKNGNSRWTPGKPKYLYVHGEVVLDDRKVCHGCVHHLREVAVGELGGNEVAAPELVLAHAATLTLLVYRTPIIFFPNKRGVRVRIAYGGAGCRPGPVMPSPHVGVLRDVFHVHFWMWDARRIRLGRRVRI
ncbi:non-heme dioxygenase in morphine synthesis N-terminal-domain-containing protein [Lactarius psammicola]|nr:non-heme dioxygenase in morphine synthesis N-terminal-domain-containing protein [Lactarius psammicola]